MVQVSRQQQQQYQNQYHQRRWYDAICCTFKNNNIHDNMNNNSINNKRGTMIMDGTRRICIRIIHQRIMVMTFALFALLFLAFNNGILYYQYYNHHQQHHDQRGDRKHPPKSLVLDDFVPSDIKVFQTKTKMIPPPCVYTWAGGWGNNVYSLLWNFIRLYPMPTTTTTLSTSKSSTLLLPSSLPCIHGFYRNVFGTLFKNLEACPDTQSMSECLHIFPETGWDTVKREVIGNLTMYHNIDDNNHNNYFYEPFHYLNKTFIHDILRTDCPSLMQHNNNNNDPNIESQQQQTQQTQTQLLPTLYCGVQVRFGDALLRNTTDNNRICNSYKRKEDLSNHTMCFEYVSKRIRKEKCPNLSIPIFLAVDHLPFLQYFRQHQGMEYPHVWSCGSSSTTSLVSSSLSSNNQQQQQQQVEQELQQLTHSKDLGVDFASIHDPNIRRMIADWLGLVLASELRPGFSSTFRETAGIYNNEVIRSKNMI